MPKAERTFRIFVSSTFSDLVAERNALQERVFPRLRALAARHGHQFQAIDLRWGVSDEAALDQQTMNICLGEIQRCQRVSPRPNFLVLLGDRYGWLPPPPKIPAVEFEQVKRFLADREELALLETWYRLDANAVGPEYRLQPRKKGGAFEAYTAWGPVEAALQAALSRAAAGLGFPADRLRVYTASATEQEIEAGALQIEAAADHVFCFFREVEGLPENLDLAAFREDFHGLLKADFPEGPPNLLHRTGIALDSLRPATGAEEVDEMLAGFAADGSAGAPVNEFLTRARARLVHRTGRAFQNMSDGGWRPDPEALAAQAALKRRLEDHVPGNIYRYRAGWTGLGITTEHIDQLCSDVYDALARIILEEIGRPTAAAAAGPSAIPISDALDEEGRIHADFAAERLRFFVGRTGMLNSIDDYLRGGEPRPLAILGSGGSGKSALAAKAIEQALSAFPHAEVVYRFIGTTPSSANVRSLLDGLCREISRRYGTDESDVPADYRELVPLFRTRLSSAAADRPLFLFLDSLDQLSAQYDAGNLAWLPDTLPDHARLVVTTRPEYGLAEKLALKGAARATLGGLSREEGDSLLSAWLADAGRTLQPMQRESVLDRFTSAQGAPLYLKLAFEEARLWASGDGWPPAELAEGITGIIRDNLIERLADEANHGEVLVSHALGYLAASRFGIAEDEMVDLLSRDPDVYRQFFFTSYHEPADLVKAAAIYLAPDGPASPASDRGGLDMPRAAGWLRMLRRSPEKMDEFLASVLPRADGPRIPIVLWSRLSLDLEPYLSQRASEGRILLNFFHRELNEVATGRYLGDRAATAFHKKLAAYFRFKADPAADRSWTGGSARGLSELPHHLTQAGVLDELSATLTDFRFLEHKAAEVGVEARSGPDGEPVRNFTGVLHLEGDFDAALAELPGGGVRSADREPLIVTGVDFGEGLVVVCPWCGERHPLDPGWPGTDRDCPACSGPLRINRFSVQRVPGGATV